MVIDKKNSKVLESMEVSKPMLFKEKKPFGLKFLESDPGFARDPISCKPTRGCRSTATPNGTAADVYVD